MLQLEHMDRENAKHRANSYHAPVVGKWRKTVPQSSHLRMLGGQSDIANPGPNCEGGPICLAPSDLTR